jgi:hypothetical protein
VASTRFKIDPLTIGLAVLAVVCIVIGAVIVSGHPKRGALAFIVGVLFAAGAVYAAMRAGKAAPAGPAAPAGDATE